MQDSCSCCVLCFPASYLLPPPAPLMFFSSGLPTRLLKWQLQRQYEAVRTLGTPGPIPDWPSVLQH